jgi:uncharacterized protein
MEANPKHVKVRWVLIYLILISIGLTFININPQNQNFIAITYSLTVLPLCFLLLRKCDKNQISLAEIVGKFPEENIWLGLIGMAIIGMSFMVGSLMLTGSLISIALPNLLTTSNSQSYDFTPVSSPADLILQFGFMVVVAPFSEEFLFRGIILNRWIEKWGVTKALIASSCLFGILHLNVIGSSMYGLMLGILYLKYQTLWVTVFCHVINNAAVFFIFKIGSNIESKSISSEDINDPRVLLLFLGVFISAVSLLFLWLSKLRFPKGYVQPSHSTQLVSNAGYNCPSNMYASRLIGGSIITILSGLMMIQSDIYKSNFTAEPYKSLTSLNKNLVDDYKRRLEEIIVSDSVKENKIYRIKAGSNVLLLIGDIYEKESKLMKDPTAVKLAIEKSRRMKELAEKIVEDKMSFDSKILTEIK